MSIKNKNNTIKKLSFNDYITSSKPAGKTAKKRTDKSAQPSVDKPAHTSNSKQVEPLTGIAICPPADKSVDRHTDTPAIPYTDIPATRAASSMVKEHKTKATYYLGKQEREMLTSMYIQQLKRDGKGDRSALICEAIRLLYKQAAK